jgi:TPR repeat protein
MIFFTASYTKINVRFQTKIKNLPANHRRSIAVPYEVAGAYKALGISALPRSSEHTVLSHQPLPQAYLGLGLRHCGADGDSARVSVKPVSIPCRAPLNGAELLVLFAANRQFFSCGLMENCLWVIQAISALPPVKTSPLCRLMLLPSNVGLTKSGNALLAFSLLFTLSVRGQTADDYFQRGIKELNANYLDAAISDFTNAITLTPDLADAYVYRGVAEGGKGDLDGAIVDLNKAIATKPDDFGAYDARGDIHYNRHEFKDAITDFRKALELAPTDGDAQFRIWLIRVRLGERDAATQELQQYLDSPSAEDRDAWIAKMGRFLPRQMTPSAESLKPALDANLFQAAKDSNPNRDAWQHSEAYFYAGSVCMLDGDKAKAVEYFQECLKVNQKGLAAYQSAVAELQFLKADGANASVSSANNADTPSAPAYPQTNIVHLTPQPSIASGAGVTTPAENNPAGGTNASPSVVDAPQPPAPTSPPENIPSAGTNAAPITPDTASDAASLRKQADNGVAEAQCQLGNMYEKGNGIAQDYAQALSWYQKAADQGNSEGERKMGIMYGSGHGVTQDYSQALIWYHKSADLGNAKAMTDIGAMYANGYGVAQDYTQALSWFHKAADLGDTTAQIDIGSMYNDGHGVPQDRAEAVSWFRKAADLGDAAAQRYLGLMYQHGQGVSQDYNLAMEWFEKAAKQGDAEAQSQIEKANTASAATFTNDSPLDAIQQAAKAGNPSAEYQLALRLLNGSARSPAAAKVLSDLMQDYNQFASANYVSGDAVNDYIQSNGDPVGHSTHFYNNPAYFKSQMFQECLQKYYALQKVATTVVKQEIEQAVPLMQASASANFIEAMNTLSVWYDLGQKMEFYATYGNGGKLTVYNYGEIVPNDEAKSFDLVKKSADLGSAEGMRLVGIHYATGKGVQKDVNEGVSWMQKASNGGDLAALSLLSKILLNGGINVGSNGETTGEDDGYPKDPRRAYIDGRILQLKGQPDSLARKWGDDAVQNARLKLQPQELLDSESQVEVEAAKIKIGQ